MNTVLLLGFLCTIPVTEQQLGGNGGLPGGIGGASPADDEVNTICEQVQSEVENVLNENFIVFEPVAYKTQVVAGLNYFIKVKVQGENDSEESYIHIRVYLPLAYTNEGPSLSKVQTNKTAQDEIDYID